MQHGHVPAFLNKETIVSMYMCIVCPSTPFLCLNRYASLKLGVWASCQLSWTCQVF